MEVRYYRDPETGLPHIYDHEQRFPVGWDADRVKRLLAELDARTDEEWIAADEAATADGGDQAVITVPATLLPEIRRLLASHKTS